MKLNRLWARQRRLSTGSTIKPTRRRPLGAGSVRRTGPGEAAGRGLTSVLSPPQNYTRPVLPIYCTLP